MKIKMILMISVVIGILSCEDKETSQVDKLTDGVWISETTSIKYENLDFKEDMTYKITELVNSPFTDNEAPFETGNVSGDWSLESNKIAFLTAYANLNFDIPTFDGQPLDSFIGYQCDGIFVNTSEFDRVINIEGDTVFPDSEYSPTTWLIEELTDKSLIVKRGTDIIKYKKQ